MISISNLTPAHRTEVSIGERPAASADTSALKAGRSETTPMRARVAHSAQSIFDAATPVVIKEILALLGKDIPDARAHARYLDTLKFSALCARRDQLLAEHKKQLDREELNRQPELSERPLRQQKLFNGRTS
jgi:hypothetical protein